MLAMTNKWVWVKRFILIMASLVIFACDAEIDAQKSIQVAKEYLDQNKLREAVIELKNALQADPNNAEARYLLGGVNLDIGDMATAEKEFRRAATAGWSEEKTQIGLARVMAELKSYQKILDEINVKDAYTVTSRANLTALRALAQAGLGDLELATPMLNKAVELDAKAFYVMKTSIQMKLLAGDKEDASKTVNQALETFGENKELRLLSAIVALNNNDKSTAASAYRKVIELEPTGLATIYGRRARIDLARLEILDKNFEKAQITLEPLFKQNDNDPEANFVGGMLAFEQGKQDLAEERLLKVLKVAPDHVQTQLLFGAVNYAQKDYEQAAYYISKYINSYPDNLMARKLLGRTYMRLGQNNEAQAALQPGLDASGDDAELLGLIGILQLQGGDTVSGIKDLEKAVKAAPESSILKSELAKAYISAGETANAIKQLNTIIAKGGDQRQAEVLLISAHIKAEQYDKAIVAALALLRKNPDDPAVLSLVGNVFVVSNDRSEARKYFNKALQIDSGYVPATMLLARLEELEEHPDKAEVLYKKLAESHKENVTPLMELARLAEARKNTKDMLFWLEQARSRVPMDTKSRKLLAEYYLRDNQLVKVAELIKEATDIDSRDSSLLVLRARLQMTEGQNNKALATLNELVTRVPDSVFARTLLGEVYLKLGQRSDAHRQFDLVLEKQPYYLPAMTLMAKLEMQSGNIDEAKKYAGLIQKVQPDLYLGYELAADISMLKKNFVEAEAGYKKALQHKQLAELAIKLSDASARTGKFDEATKPLLSWLNDHPDDVRVLMYLGNTYQNMKQNHQAISTYEKVLALQSDNAVALNNLAWLYSLDNNPKALGLAERAYKANPKDSGVQDTYGWLLVRNGQTADGRRILERVMEVLSEVPEVRYHYAVALLKSNEKEAAHKILENLLKSDKAFEGREEAEQLMK